MSGYVRDGSVTHASSTKIRTTTSYLLSVGLHGRCIITRKNFSRTCMGFKIVFRVEEKRKYLLPNYEAWLAWWEATSLGCFSTARVIEDKEGDYERLLKKYG